MMTYMIWLAVTLFATVEKGNCTLHLTITNLKNDQGNMAVALFNNKDTFLEEYEEYRGKIVEIKSKGSITVSLEDLPEGTYVASIFHDENGNGKMDKNIMGMPTEDYGFSNDAKGTLGPPSFEDASFKITGKETSIHITLR